MILNSIRIFKKDCRLLILVIILALFSCNKNAENSALIYDTTDTTDSTEVEKIEDRRVEDKKEDDDKKDIESENKAPKSINEYNTVNFGYYYINDDSVKDPIEWYVLNVDKKNKRAMLMSKYVLDARAIHESYWATNFYFTNLGMYLNNDFIKEAFSEDEKEKILLFYEDNYFFGVYDDIKNYTRVSLPSTDEIIRLLPNVNDRVAYPTNYAASKNYMEINTMDTCKGSVYYWLRNKGLSDKSFQYIYYTGKIDKSGKLQSFNTIGVRPIIWIDMSSFLPEKYEFYMDNAINIDKLECKIKSEEGPDDLNNYKVGDTFYYGYHFDFEKNKKIHQMSWEVVDKDVENDKILVINKYPSYCKPYNDNMQSVNWEKSTLRKWLNDDYYKYCFTDEERDRILETKVYNTFNYKNDKETSDYIYIMSRDELDKYYPTDSAKHAMRDITTISTESIAKYEKKFASDSNITRFDILNAMIWNCNYWVRDVIISGKNALNVNGRGEIDTIGEEMTNERMQVRPCMWLSLQNSKDDIKKIEVVKENIEYNNYLYIDKDATTISFGKYRQDGIYEDINDVTDINWIVIDRDKKKNEATLMSEKILEFLPYQTFYMYYYNKNNWYSSTLRKWLNEAFYNAAFDEEEKSKIVVQDTSIWDYFVDDEGICHEKTVYDSVTLPSHEDLVLLTLLDEELLKARTTKYALIGIDNIFDKSDINNYLKETSYRYWQREHNSDSASGGNETINFVEDNGKDMNRAWSYSFFGVRPVIKVKYCDDYNLMKKNDRVQYLDKLSENAKFKDIIKMGHMNQENLLDNSDIEWVVLNNDKKNRKALLISKKILDYYNFKNDLPKDYDSEELNNLWRIPWDESKIKSWLNDEFLNTILTKSEAQNIVEENGKGKLFILSIDEINNYIPIITLRKSRETRNANVKLDSSSYSEDKYVRWWARDPIVNDPKFEHLYYIDKNGKFDDYTWTTFPANYAIRPAMWVKY